MGVPQGRKISNKDLGPSVLWRASPLSLLGGLSATHPDLHRAFVDVCATTPRDNRRVISLSERREAPAGPPPPRPLPPNENQRPSRAAASEPCEDDELAQALSYFPASLMHECLAMCGQDAVKTESSSAQSPDRGRRQARQEPVSVSWHEQLICRNGLSRAGICIPGQGPFVFVRQQSAPCSWAAGRGAGTQRS